MTDIKSYFFFSVINPTAFFMQLIQQRINSFQIPVVSFLFDEIKDVEELDPEELLVGDGAAGDQLLSEHLVDVGQNVLDLLFAQEL